MGVGCVCGNGMVAVTYNGKALLSGFEFEKQKYMTKDEIKAKAEMLLKNSRETQGEFVQVYNNGFEDGVNFVLQNLQQCNVSGTLPLVEILEILDMLNKAHEELAKSEISQDNYSPISWALVDAKKRISVLLSGNDR